MNFFSTLLRWLFFASLLLLGVGFSFHLIHNHLSVIAYYGAFLLLASPAIGFVYLTAYYLSQKNKKLAFLSFLVFLILALNILLQK